MAKIKDKYINFGNGPQQLNDSDVPSVYTPVNYTPKEVGSEGINKISANLKGIDNEFATIQEKSILNAIIFG